MRHNRPPMSLRFRLLGLLPLGFYAAHLVYNISIGEAWVSLWMCNLANVLLGAGLLLAWPGLIRLAVIWAIPGVPLWVMEMILSGEAAFTSFLTHVGGTVLGLAVLVRIRASRRIWPVAWVFGLLVQGACRLFTPESENVNIAHKIYRDWTWFGAYWQFWLFTAAAGVVCLWLLNAGLVRLFPPRAPRSRGKA